MRGLCKAECPAQPTSRAISMSIVECPAQPTSRAISMSIAECPAQPTSRAISMSIADLILPAESCIPVPTFQPKF